MKLFVFDVDDTLVDKDKILRPRTIKNLNLRLANGDAVAIASGRPFVGIDHYLSQLQPGLKFAIGANGAAVYDAKGDLLEIEGIRYNDFANFYQRHLGVKKYGGEIYAYSVNEVVYFEYGQGIELEDRLNHVPLRDLKKNPMKDDDTLLKFMVVLNPLFSNRIHLSDNERRCYHVMRSDPSFLEFTNPNVDKASGVEFLRCRLGISKDHVYCFGDQGNDLKMIASFEGVAMGNAISECKKAATYVTKDVKDDGVSYALENLI